MRVCFLESPAALLPGSSAWATLREGVAAQAPDVLVMNEMPFGPWVAAGTVYRPDVARETVQLHERAIEDLRRLPVPLVLSSRPVPAGERLANEAFALVGGEYVFLHQKQYFPQEEGFYEESWFTVGREGFGMVRIGDVRIGVLLCTELMFNERARAYGRAGADLIVAPRASGRANARWLTAGAMAALVSGSYVVSSNRAGAVPGGPTFGGAGFAYAPGGDLIAGTSSEEPIRAFVLDLQVSRRAKLQYPCTVKERA